MCKSIFTKPRFLRGFVSLILFTLLLLQSCVSDGKKPTSVVNSKTEESRKEETSSSQKGNYKTITFTNNTFFRLNISIGSMVRELEPINPGKTLSIPNIYSATEVYYITFDLPLVKTGNYDILNMQPANTSRYFQIGKTNEDQNIIIETPGAFEEKNSYIVFTNNGNTGGLYLSDTRISRLNCIHKHAKDNINQNETEIFQINPGNKKLYISGAVNLEISEIRFQPSCVYYFTYSTNKATLTDARPLHRIGESSWVKTIDNTTGIMPLVKNNNIHLFASTGKNIIRYVYDSAGNDNKTKSINNGDGFTTTYISSVNDGFIVAGYEELGKNKYKPHAHITGEDGVLRRALSEPVGYESARYFNTAQKDNTWLFVGDSVKNGSVGSTAYARLARDDGNKLIVINEWGESSFPKSKDNGKPQCGNIKAAAYNTKMSCWLITGEIINENYTGFYLAQINNDKTIQLLDSFKEMEFYKILIDDNGMIYLAGQEEKENKVFAVLVKWDAKEKIIWRLNDQPSANSFYYDAILNTENKNIVLAGTMQAKDEYGEDGTPFIEAIDLINEKLLWREVLSDSFFNKTNLVTALTFAPDYGYVLALSGIEDGVIRKPFKVARINSQGKFLKH